MPGPRLKNTLQFVNLAPGTSVVLPHGLMTSVFRPLAPDVIFIPSPDLDVTASDEVAVTLRNQGPEPLSGSILVEAWHTIERTFSDRNEEDLPVKPYVVVGVENEGAPPIPPFPTPAPTTTTIYARIFGNDTTGNGTLATPYRTFQRAIRDVPFIVPPGVIYLVDITGIGVETLPDNYELPSWVISRIQNDAITITAEHKLASALTPAEATINAGVKNTDADTGMFSVADGTKAYTPSALKGLFVYGADDEGEPGLVGVIHENSGTEIFITSNEGDDWTFPFTIRECSAELRGQGVDVDFGGAITVNAPHEINFFGISVVPIDPSSSLGFVQQGGIIWFEGCNLVRPELDSPTNRIRLVACNIVMPMIGGPTYLRQSRVVDGGTDGDGPDWISPQASEGLTIFGGTALDNCTTIQVTEIGRLGGALSLSNILIKNAVGDAIFWPGGTASITQVRIENSVAGDTPGNAFVGRGGLLAFLDQVVGTGNAGVGIRVLDGAQVEMTATTTVTGTVNDQEVGTLGPGAYPAVPFNITDPATFCRLFRNV